MRLLFTFMQNPWQGLVWGVDGGIQRRYSLSKTTLQQGKFEGYGSQTYLNTKRDNSFLVPEKEGLITQTKCILK